MFIYEVVKRYNEVTGKPVNKKVFKEIRCDYTGEVLDGCFCEYFLNYNDNDPYFTEDTYDTPLYEITYNLMSEPYHFKDSMEVEMMKEYINKGSYTFEEMCRKARVTTALRLIKDKTIVLENLTKE